MPDVQSLIVRAGYDGTDVTRGLAKNEADVNRFAANVAAVQGQTRAIKLPNLGDDGSIQKAVLTLKALGVTLHELERDTSGGRVFEALSQDAALATNIFAKFGAAATVVTTEVTATAAAMARADGSLRARIGLLAEGAQFTSTQAASLRELREVYARLSRELASSEIPLERRIALERELVRIRQQFVQVTAASRASLLPVGGGAQSIASTAAALTVAGRNANTANRSFRLLNQETGLFTTLGKRASTSAVAVGFGLESLARGGVAAGGGLRAALRGVSSFAVWFGAKGLLVAGIAVATAAIIDLFRKSREEMEKTQQAFETNVAEMIRNADIIGLLQKLQSIEIGDPSKGPGLVGFKDGLLDLKARLAELEEAEKAAFQSGNFLIGISKQGAEIRQLREKITPLQAEYDKLANTINNFPTLPRLPALTQAVTVTGKGDASSAEEAFKRLKASVDNTSASAEQLRENFEAQERIGAALLVLHAKVVTLLEAQTSETSEAAVQLRDMKTSMEAIHALQVQLRRETFSPIPEIDPVEIRELIDRVIQQAPKSIDLPLVFKPRVSPLDLRNFEHVVEQLRDAQGLLDFSQLTGDVAFQREAEQRLERAQKRVQEYAQTIEFAMIAANIPLEQQRGILAEIERLLQGLKTAAAESSTLAENLHLVTTAGRGILQTADSLGLIGDNARTALEGVLQLTDALAAIKAGGALGAVTGAIGLIGGVATLLQGLGVIADPQLTAERDRILRGNTEELADLNLTLRGFGANIEDQFNLLNELPTVIGPGSRLKEVVEAMSFSLAELNVIARRYNITLLDAAGNVVPQAFLDLADAIRKTAAAALSFTDSLDDRRTQIDLLNRSRGIPDTAQQAIEDTASLFKALAPALYDQFFAGIAGADPAAQRAAIEQFLTAWFSELIDPELFAGFANKSEVASVINTWLDGLDRMTDAANELTKSLLNVPAGFKIDRARFQATMTETAEALRGGLIQFNGPAKSKSGIGQGTVNYTFNFGPGSISADGKNAREFFDEIKLEAKRRVRALSPTAKAADAFDI